MRILIIGDIVGKPGKHICSQLIPPLRTSRGIDFVIANAENTTAGSGLTPAMFQKLMHYGIDACTMGDHIYRRIEITQVLDRNERIVRPANYPAEASGRDHTVVDVGNGVRIAIVSLMGRIFMNVRSDCPFHAIDRVLGQIPEDVHLRVVDVHAETTSEKVALGWYLDGRVTAVVGTHTHVQTADERILPKGTAYITDLGMTGPHDSVLGRDKDAVIQSLRTNMPYQYHVAQDDVILHGVIVECDPDTGRAASIERVALRAPEDGDVAADDQDD